MSWKKKNNFSRTVTFRITLWYAGLFGTLSLAAFAWVYLDFTSALNREVDRELLDDAIEFETLYDQHGLKALQHELKREAESNGIGRVFMRFLSPRGEILASSDLSVWNGLKPPSRLQGLESARYETLFLPGRSHEVRTILRPVSDGNVLQIGITLQENEALMKRYRHTSGAALAMMLLCGGLVGWMVSRRAMSGVSRVTQTAVRIGKGDLSRRVPPGKEGREIDDLAQAFNEMLDRIQTLIKELEEVTNNIAHDLRSPITRIRGIAETTRTGGESLEDYREMAGAVIEESDRLVEMINTMLEIAQTDSGLAKLSQRPVNVREIIQDAVELFRPMADDQGITLESDAPERPLVVQGDVTRLQRVIANLLDNAIKYTPAGGRVLLSAAGTDAQVIVNVSDTGMGISETDLPRIFDRFYRADRSRSTPGNGLGLSLARSIVRAHGGAIEVKSSPSPGSTFTIYLPKTTSTPDGGVR